MQNQVHNSNSNNAERRNKFPSKPPLSLKRNSPDNIANNTFNSYSSPTYSSSGYSESPQYVRHTMSKNNKNSNTNGAPPGLPVPILAGKLQDKQQTNVNPNLEQTKTERNTKNHRSRRRSKRRNKKQNKNKEKNLQKLCDANNDEIKQEETDYEDETDDDSSDNEEKEDERDDKEIWVSKKNIINAIEIERRNHELTKLRLVQLHEFHMKKIQQVKKENAQLTKKLALYSRHVSSENDIEKLRSQVEQLKQVNKASKQHRTNDINQLHQTDKENQKLSIILHYQRQQLASLQSQYHLLCDEHVKCLKEKSGDDNCSEAQRIVNGIDSLNIMETESIMDYEESTRLKGSVMHCNKNGTRFIDGRCERNGRGGQNLKKSISDDPWFQKMIDENAMLERHIRFMRHIIESEQKRCDFKQLIVGINNINNNIKQNQDDNENDNENENENDNSTDNQQLI